MARQTPSRRKLKPGDIFTISFPGVGFLFGQVVYTDMSSGPMGPGANLIYVYDHIGTTRKDYADALLTSDSLLIPPAFINRLPWSHGYFENVGYRELDADTVLGVHCFELLGRRQPTFVDLHGDSLDKKVDPCGVWGLDSYRTIDDQVSGKLGIPLAPN